MSSVDQVIQLRSLINELHDQEMIIFVTHLMKQCGKEAILTPFCNQFFESNIINKDSKLIQTAIHIVNTIIRSRDKSKQCNKHAIIKYKLDSLSSLLIGETGSYLTQNDYISLSLVNRATYIGCNLPNRLTMIDLSISSKYSSIALTKYSSLTHLKLNLSKFNQFKLTPYNPILPNLRSLSLYGNKSCDLNLEVFLSQTSIDFTKIKHLDLNNFGRNGNNPFSFCKFKSLLELFSNLESIILRGTYLSMMQDDTWDIGQVVPNLRTYRNYVTFNYGVTNRIISKLGAQLVCLQLALDEHIMIPSTILFCKLEELDLYHNCQDPLFLKEILDKTNSLKRVTLNNVNFGSAQKCWMRKMIAQNNALNDILLYDTRQQHHFTTMTDVLVDALYGLNDKHKNRKIRLLIHYGNVKQMVDDKMNSRGIFAKVDRLQSLLNSGVGHFVLNIKIRWDWDQDIGKELKFFQEKFDYLKVGFGHYDRKHFHIYIRSKTQ